MKGLRQRVVTAILFGVVVLGSILFDKISFVVLMGIIAAMCSWEYAKTVENKPLIFSIITGLLGYSILFFWGNHNLEHALLILAIAFGAILCYFLFPTKIKLNHQTFAPVIAMIYIGGALGLISHHFYERMDYHLYIIGILVLIWISDTGAYLVGSQIGKRKLLPRISPNKTVEGLLGGLILVMLGGYIIGKVGGLESRQWWMIMSLCIWVFGSLGDLVQSSIKRQYNTKDTGTLLPGHGGVWDRFDSFILAAPMVVLIDKYMF